MFQALETHRAITKLLKTADDNLTNHGAATAFGTPLGRMTNEDFTAPFIQAAALAKDTPHQTERVFRAVMHTLHSPFTNPEIDAKLLEAARTMRLSEWQKANLSLAENVLTNYQASPALKMSLPSRTQDTTIQYQATQAASAAIQEQIDGSSGCFHASILIAMAQTGCAYKNWKAVALLDAVIENIKTPEQLLEISKAVPGFIQRCLQGDVQSHNLTQIIANAPQEHELPGIGALAIELHAERGLTLIRGELGPRERMAMAVLAKRDPDFQLRATERLLYMTFECAQYCNGERASNYLELVNDVSGRPLGAFNSLASRELCIGRDLALAPKGKQDSVVPRRIMVASQSANVESFMLTHGPDQLKASDVLKLFLPNQNPTALDVLRREAFANASLYLGQSPTTLRQAWGELCLSSTKPETQRLGAALVAQAIAPQAA